MDEQEYMQMKSKHTLYLWIQNCQDLADLRVKSGRHFGVDDAIPLLVSILNHNAALRTVDK